MPKFIKIELEKFNELRKLSIAIGDAIKNSDKRALGLSSDMINQLIDIEDMAIDENAVAADEATTRRHGEC